MGSRREACYHVIDRGNYRKDLFAFQKTGEIFTDLLFKTCFEGLIKGWFIGSRVGRSRLKNLLADGEPRWRHVFG